MTGNAEKADPIYKTIQQAKENYKVSANIKE
jgi:hypothetical protein